MRLYECPLTYVTGDSWEIAKTVYRSTDGAHLLLAGGWADQPHWFVEATDLFKIEQNRAMRISDGDKAGNSSHRRT